MEALGESVPDISLSLTVSDVFSESTICAAEACVSEPCPRSGQREAFSELAGVACAAREEAILLVVKILNVSEVGERLVPPVFRQQLCLASAERFGSAGAER